MNNRIGKYFGIKAGRGFKALPTADISIPDAGVFPPAANAAPSAMEATLPTADVSIPGAGVFPPAANTAPSAMKAALPTANAALPAANAALLTADAAQSTVAEVSRPAEDAQIPPPLKIS